MSFSAPAHRPRDRVVGLDADGAAVVAWATEDLMSLLDPFVDVTVPRMP